MSKKTNLSFLILLMTTTLIIFNYLPQTKESLALVPIVSGGETVTTVREDCTGYEADTCFTSLFAWEAAYGGIDFAAAGCTAGDLVCANTSAVAKIDGTWTNPDETAVTIGGWTTGVSNYIKIYTTAEARHDGKWNGNAYILTSADYFGTIEITEANYITIEGLQIENTATGSSLGSGISTYGGHNINLTVSHNIIKKTNAINAATYRAGISGYGNIGLKCYNNVMYDYWYGIFLQEWADNSDVLIYNNTIIDSGTSGITLLEYSSNVTYRLKNNLIQGSGTSDYDINQGDTTEYIDNLSEDATSPNDEHDGKVVIFTNEGGNDFHLDSTDSNAKDAGTTLSDDTYLPFSDDIDSDTRSGTWDIGADEEGGTPPPACAETCYTNQCSTYLNCSSVSGTCATGYCCSGACDTDTTPPVISSISSSSIIQNSATVTWTTDESSTSQTEYGQTTSYGSQTTEDTNLVTSHSVNLTGLSSGTDYHY